MLGFIKMLQTCKQTDKVKDFSDGKRSSLLISGGVLLNSLKELPQTGT